MRAIGTFDAVVRREVRAKKVGSVIQLHRRSFCETVFLVTTGPPPYARAMGRIRCFSPRPFEARPRANFPPPLLERRRLISVNTPHSGGPKSANIYLTIIIITTVSRDDGRRRGVMVFFLFQISYPLSRKYSSSIFLLAL